MAQKFIELWAKTQEGATPETYKVPTKEAVVAFMASSIAAHNTGSIDSTHAQQFSTKVDKVDTASGLIYGTRKDPNSEAILQGTYTFAEIQKYTDIKIMEANGTDYTSLPLEAGSSDTVKIGLIQNVVRTEGDQSIAGIKTFSDTTDSNGIDSGAVIIAGGLGVQHKANIGGNTHIAGQLAVDGNVTIGIAGTSNKVTLYEDIEVPELESIDIDLKFATNVYVPTAANTDDSQRAANTTWVAQRIKEASLATQQWLPAVNNFTKLWTAQQITDHGFDPAGTYLQRALENYTDTSVDPAVVHPQGTYQWIGKASPQEWVLYSDQNEFVTHTELATDLAPLVESITGARVDTEGDALEGTYKVTINHQNSSDTFLTGIAPSSSPWFTGTLKAQVADFTGIVTVDNATTSTSTETGALIVKGGVGIEGATHIGGAVTLGANLNVQGASSTEGNVTLGATDQTATPTTVQLNGKVNNFDFAASKEGIDRTTASGSKPATELQIVDATTFNVIDEPWISTPTPAEEETA